jgi:hypothetical protein
MSVGVLLALAVTVIASGSGSAADVPATCSIHALGTVSGAANLSAAREWHLQRTEAVIVRLLASGQQSRVQPGITLFGLGLALPALSARYGYFVEGPDQVGDLSRLTRALAFSFRTDSCSASLLAVVDDQNPLLTVVGGIAALLAGLSVVGLIWLGRGPGRLGRRIAGAGLGLLAGIGLSLLLQQVVWLDPRSYDTLIPPALGLIVGAACPGALPPRLWTHSRP